MSARLWQPGWARRLAMIAVVLAAPALVWSTLALVDGLSDAKLAGISLLAGGIVLVLALAVAVPAIVFLRRGGAASFAMAMTALALLAPVVVLALYSYASGLTQ